ncbi:hypothetical protein [Tessaracoccus antarcticus]|uniref:Uncharacterized protein n=1 Tax=Tessaracoccus antarcticus TaxID=2479848 RepID=A0A3M0GDE1_9ACTN|nr:hypothetical protein [Tessaracoccus antarcticus]RMB59603.1 hypothetical protein EAX62_07410 [Tessaracoccus antarcticus]
MSRQIITKDRVLEVLGEGSTELHLEKNDIITAVAIEVAEQRGLRIVRSDVPPRATPPAATTPGGAPTPTRTPPSTVHEGAPTPRQIKDAVMSQLGTEPDGLDAIIAKVLKG